MNILQINGSARAQGAHSTTVANLITQQLLAKNPSAKLTVRHLATQPPAPLDGQTLGAVFTPADKRTPEQAKRVAQDDDLIAEVISADVLVLGVPMYNFGLSVQLKSWLDAICRNGVAFKYTDKGPVGLFTGKKVLVGFARGGIYRGTVNDSQTPYFNTMLPFMGMTDIQYFYAEGLNMGEAALQAGLADAKQQILTAFQ
jgi:FMN-dependent NADH-azoreductase